MTGWHHQLNAHEFGWTLGVGDGQGGLACCDSWGRKELDMTESLNWTETLEHRLNSCVTGAWLLCSMWGLLRSGIKCVPPALAGGFFTTESPGKPLWTYTCISVYRYGCCSVTKSCLTLFPRVCPSSCPVNWYTIQPSHPLLSPCPPAFNLSQHQGLFQGVSSSHQVAKVLKLQLQHQSFQWIFRTDFL